MWLHASDPTCSLCHKVLFLLLGACVAPLTAGVVIGSSGRPSGSQPQQQQLLALAHQQILTSPSDAAAQVAGSLVNPLLTYTHETQRLVVSQLGQNLIQQLQQLAAHNPTGMLYYAQLELAAFSNVTRSLDVQTILAQRELEQRMGLLAPAAFFYGGNDGSGSGGGPGSGGEGGSGSGADTTHGGQEGGNGDRGQGLGVLPTGTGGGTYGNTAGEFAHAIDLVLCTVCFILYCKTCHGAGGYGCWQVMAPPHCALEIGSEA